MTLAHLRNPFGTRRAPAKPRRQSSGPGAARLRKHPRVLWVDGRDQGYEDWFVNLRPGWHWEGDAASHAYGFTTLAEALAAINRAQPCDCDQCRAEIAERAP